jgi:phage-related protein
MMGVATNTMNNITTSHKKTTNAVDSFKTAFASMMDTFFQA